jgi:hypothetical protein
MTDEEAVINEAEQVVNDEMERRQAHQIKEHQAMMPFLASYATDSIAQADRDPNGIHLFVLQQASEGDVNKADNPLGMALEESTVGEMIPWFTFPDIAEATSSMSTPVSAVLFNEVRKQRSTAASGIAVYLKVSDKVQFLYCAGKLTVTQIQPNGDPMTKTAVIGQQDPHEFFQTLPITVEQKALIGALVSMAEMGKFLETQQPETYKLMLKRTIDDLESDE